MDEKNIILEQYRITVEMADRISARREGANKIFLSANSIIFAFLATQDIFTFVHMMIAIFGLLLALVWSSIIKNYRSLNSAKYGVIHEIETKLPIQPYTDEWTKLKKGKDKSIYGKLSVVEQQLPMVFLGFYAILFLYVLCQLY